MLPNLKTTALAAVTALSVALTSVAPAHALGRDQRKFLQGVAAALIVGAIVRDAQGRTRAAPAPRYVTPGHTAPRVAAPAPQPHYRPAPPRQDQYTTGRVIGSSNSVHATLAAQTFNSYSLRQRQAIQSRLRAYGYYRGSIDGAFGPATLRAVQAYARDSGGERQLQTRAGSHGLYDSLIA
ncbi:MAG: peptidoglycan-binding protein [Rhodobacteraceae bacterium]|nr:peptidoglycan-binding protein [Paracoccaceae bacterium]